MQAARDEESKRQQVLRGYDILDTPPEEAFDRIARLAAWIAGVPVALIGFLDGDRQWYKARAGDEGEGREVPLGWSFCVRTVEHPGGVTQVKDLSQDPQFAAYPPVAGEPHLRFYAGAPLVSPEGLAVGTICVLDFVPRELEPDQLEALSTLADQVMAQMELRRRVAALEASQAYQRETLARMQALGQVSQALVGEGDLDRLLQTLVDTVASALPADRVTLILFDPQAEEVTHFVRGGPGAEQVVRVAYGELMEGLSGWALRERKPAVSPGGQPDPRETPEVRRRRAETLCGAVLVLPLHYQGRALGTLTAINRPEQPDFSEEDLDLLEAMTAQASAAVANAGQAEELERREALYRGLVESLAEGVVVQDATGKITASNRAVEGILGLTPDQMAGRTSMDPRWRAVHEDGSDFPGETHPTVVALQTGLPQRDVIMGVHKPGGSLTWISINAQPLSHPGESRPYAVVASFFDITESKKLQDSLRDQAQRDPLTGLANRRLLETRLNEEFSRSRRYSLPLSLLLLDVDEFKSYNDTFGHPDGDVVLSKVGKLLGEALRGEDLAARYGGEEFAVLLPNTGLEAARQVAERIRKRAEDTAWPRRNITLSVGVAQLEPDTQEASSLISAADAALYAAKRGGRNRVA